MLEQMSESGTPRTLARGADSVPEIHVDDWNPVVFVKNHMKAVWQRELGVIQLKRRGVGTDNRRVRNGRQRDQDREEDSAFHKSILVCFPRYSRPSSSSPLRRNGRRFSLVDPFMMKYRYG